MEPAEPDFAAFGEAIVFLDHFKDLPDPRQRGKVMYPLEEVLLLCLLAVLAGAETFVDIARFGEKKLELLRRFRTFPDGTPSHDHLGDILATLDATEFQRCFVTWVAAVTGAPADVIAIDGKTVRGSARHRPRGTPRRRSTWSPPSPRASGWCSARSRWRTSRTRSSPSPNCSICCPSTAPSSPSTPWAASAPSPRKSSPRRPTTCSP